MKNYTLRTLMLLIFLGLALPGCSKAKMSAKSKQAKLVVPHRQAPEVDASRSARAQGQLEEMPDSEQAAEKKGAGEAPSQTAKQTSQGNNSGGAKTAGGTNNARLIGTSTSPSAGTKKDSGKGAAQAAPAANVGAAVAASSNCAKQNNWSGSINSRCAGGEATAPAVAATAPANTKQETAVPAAAVSSATKTKEKRVLNVNVVYANELEQKENKTSQADIAEVWSKYNLNNVKLKALRATNHSDEAYETTLISTPESPKISNSLFHLLGPTAICDLNLIGACVVLEKDFVNGKERTAAYLVGSTPVNNWNLLGNIRVVRLDVSSVDKALAQRVTSALRDKGAGIFVYSLANRQDSIVAEMQDSVAAEDAAQMIAKAQAQSNEEKAAKIQEVTDEKEIEDANKIIADAIAKGTSQAGAGGERSFNMCAVTSVKSEEFPKRGLRTVRRMFVFDFANIHQMLAGKEEIPFKIGKGVLYCKLGDGRVQKVNIQITEYISPFTVGLVFSKTNQNLVASGVGFANGALDILTEKDFGAIVEVDAMVLVGGFSIAPIILNGTGKGTPFTLAGQISVSPHWTLLNVRASFGTRYEIVVDPDDT